MAGAGFLVTKKPAIGQPGFLVIVRLPNIKGNLSTHFLMTSKTRKVLSYLSICGENYLNVVVAIYMWWVSYLYVVASYLCGGELSTV